MTTPYKWQALILSREHLHHQTFCMNSQPQFDRFTLKHQNTILKHTFTHISAPLHRDFFHDTFCWLLYCQASQAQCRPESNYLVVIYTSCLHYVVPNEQNGCQLHMTGNDDRVPVFWGTYSPLQNETKASESEHNHSWKTVTPSLKLRTVYAGENFRTTCTLIFLTMLFS